MNYFRPQFHILKKRLKENRKFIQIIIGPRQVGKTTLVIQLLGQIDVPYHYQSADSIEATNSVWLNQQWETARLKLKNSKSKQLILAIDEIQKISNWSEIVKSEWDKDSVSKTNIKLILLGSSSLLIQKGLTESLAGRFELIYMNHWSFKEMEDAFDMDVDKYIWFGGYPGAYSLINNERRWKDYIKNSIVESTVSKDILMMQRIDKPALLKRLFELGCLYSGQILSFTKMLGQLQDVGNTVTLSHYLNLLDSAGLITGLEKFAIQKFRHKSSSPKFQVYNTAFISSQMVETLSEIRNQPDKWGRIVEAAIGAHLVNFALTESFEVYYWRNRNNEIDFVIERNGKIIGLEVKTGFKKFSSGINIFYKEFNPKKILLVGEKGLQFEEFLNINPIELF